MEAATGLEVAEGAVRVRNEIRFPALFRADYQEYFKLRETIYLSGVAEERSESFFQDENEVFLSRFAADQWHNSRFKSCCWRVKESICVRVQMLFHLESQGQAAGLVPSPLHITQSASARHYALQG